MRWWQARAWCLSLVAVLAAGHAGAQRSATVTPPHAESVMGRTGTMRIGQAAPARQAGVVYADDAVSSAAHADWVLYCQGCHEADAKGRESLRVPRLAGSIGYFLQVPGGREYLVQVPGVHNTGLNDRRVTAVVNYVIQVYAGDSRPADFLPYTEQEVRRYRAERPVDIALRRREMLEARQRAGLPLP